MKMVALEDSVVFYYNQCLWPANLTSQISILINLIYVVFIGYAYRVCRGVFAGQSEISSIASRTVNSFRIKLGTSPSDSLDKHANGAACQMISRLS